MTVFSFSLMALEWVSWEGHAYIYFGSKPTLAYSYTQLLHLMYSLYISRQIRHFIFCYFLAYFFGFILSHKKNKEQTKLIVLKSCTSLSYKVFSKVKMIHMALPKVFWWCHNFGQELFSSAKDPPLVLVKPLHIIHGWIVPLS